MYYKKIKTKERLPNVTGYYAVKNDVIIDPVHWSTEKKVWTFTDGTTCGATYPNYWLEPFKFDKIKTAHVQKHLNQYLAEEISLSRFTEIINDTITGQEGRSDEN